jgi:hypothetical protein
MLPLLFTVMMLKIFNFTAGIRVLELCEIFLACQGVHLKNAMLDCMAGLEKTG